MRNTAQSRARWHQIRRENHDLLFDAALKDLEASPKSKRKSSLKTETFGAYDAYWRQLLDNSPEKTEDIQ